LTEFAIKKIFLELSLQKPPHFPLFFSAIVLRFNLVINFAKIQDEQKQNGE